MFVRRYQRNRKLPARQRGISVLGWLAILALASVLATIALRVVPHYIDNFYVRGIINGLPATEIRALERAQIRTRLEKQFRVEFLDMSVRDIIQIGRNNGVTTVALRYEVREPLFGNADVVLVFDDEWQF